MACFAGSLGLQAPTPFSEDRSLQGADADSLDLEAYTGALKWAGMLFFTTFRGRQLNGHISPTSLVDRLYRNRRIGWVAPSRVHLRIVARTHPRPSPDDANAAAAGSPSASHSVERQLTPEQEEEVEHFMEALSIPPPPQRASQALGMSRRRTSVLMPVSLVGTQLDPSRRLTLQPAPPQGATLGNSRCGRCPHP